jgi:hypothetical protein
MTDTSLDIKNPRTYYTAFVSFAQDFKTKQPHQIICKHKELGIQTDTAIREIVNITKEYFLDRKTFPHAIFKTRVTLNGKSVLLSFIHKDAYFLDLKEKLDPFNKDETDAFIPHIEIAEYAEFVGLFQCFAIMTEDKILAYWTNSEWEKIQKDFQRRNPNLKVVKNQTKSPTATTH